MKTRRNERWSILQRVVFVVRNFKSLVALKFLSSKYSRRRQISHLVNLEHMSNVSSCANIDTEEEEKHCSYRNYFKNSKIEISQDGESTPTRNHEKIGDIVGITSR